MKRLLFEIGLNDKFSRNMKKIAGGADSSINKLNKSLAKTKPLSRNIDHLENKLRDLRDAQKKAFSVKDIKRYSSEIKKTSKELARLEKKGRIRGGDSGAGMKGGMLGKAGLIGMGLGAVYGGIRLGKEIVDTTAKYQRFEAVLKNSYGSGMKAKQVMSELTNFASKTPFQIDELTDSFVKLKNAGLEPSMKEMTNLGDVAASQGKSFGQLSEALLDAQMGEFERLKEFGIKAKTGKNSYKFIFKGQTTEVKKTGEAVKKYILSLGKLKGVQGGMNAISKTAGGQLSNLADNWDQLKAVMGDANRGVIKDAIGGFSSLVSAAKDYMTVPLSEKMREEHSEVRTLIGAITDYNISSEDRMGLLNQLKEQYPDFLGNIDAETVSNEELLKRLDAVNASYEKRINLQQTIEDKDNDSKKLAEIRLRKNEAQMQLSRYNLAISTGDAADVEAFVTRLPAKQRSLYTQGTAYAGNMPVAQKLGGLDEYYKKIVKEESNNEKYYKKRINKKEVILQSDKLAAFLDSKNPNLDKLSGDKKKKYEDWMSQLKSESKIVKEWTKRGLTSDNADFQRKMKNVNDLKSLISGLFEDPSKVTSTLKSNNFGNTRLLKDNVADIQGDNKIAKNLTINIDNMVESLNIVTNTLNEGTAEMKQKVLEALLAAVNDVNGA